MTPPLAPVFALVVCASVAAQTDWTLLSPTTSPPPYTAHAMAYFVPTNSTVLFGGVESGVRSSDTWIFDGTDWSQASPATVPTARVAHSMVYDLIRARLVVFGGISDTGATLGDTWEWDGFDWSLMTPATTSPAPRWAHCMAFHPIRGTTMLFGGFAGGNQNDLWEWDGVDWTQIVTGNSPSTRRATAMEWDSITGNMLLFSGYQQTNDTWMFDGTDWVLQAPVTSPPARYDHAMILDRWRDRIVMFGDLSAGDTWEWDGFDWIDRTDANPPAPRVDTYLSYDWFREEVLMFGSVATPETWRYAVTTPATFTVQGVGGCPGTNGLPPALMPTTDRPWIGEPFDVDIGQLPNNGIGLMISGLSDTTSSLGPLPASLAAIGMPGCDLQVDPVIIDALLATGVTATWTLNIPNDPMLLGQEFFSQCGALDIGANAANLTVGNYGVAFIGGK